MKRNFKIIFLSTGILFIILLCFFFKPAHYYFLREMANPNSIKFEISNNLNLRDFSVVWKSELGDEKIIFKNGIDLKKTYKKYGKNRFLVYHKNSLISEFRQFKFNNWHGHQYIFKVKENLSIKWTVKGPDSKTAEQQLPE